MRRYQGAKRESVEIFLALKKRSNDSYYRHHTLRQLSLTSSKEVPLALKELGTPSNEIEKLFLKFDGASLTYKYRFSTNSLANAWVNNLSKSLRILQPKLTDGNYGGRRHLRLSSRSFSMHFSGGSEEKALAGQSNLAVHSSQKDQDVELSLWLPGEFLKQHALAALDGWLDTNLAELREQLFNLTIGKAFRLGENLRDGVPETPALKKLTPTERVLLNFYLQRGSSEKISFLCGSAQDYSKIRCALLAKIGLDIAIPWAEHQTLRHKWLRQTLVCPSPATTH